MNVIVKFVRLLPRNRKPNHRFIILLLVAVALIGTAVHFVHRWQAKKLVDTYQKLAEQADEQGEFAKSKAYWERYLALKPDDAAARARLGKLQLRTAKKPNEFLEAYLTLQEALRNDPSLPADIHKLCAVLAMSPRINQPLEARRDLEVLLENDPNNAEYEELLAEALVRTNEYAQADNRFSSAILHDPHRLSAYDRQAFLRRQQLSRPDDGDEVIKTLLLKNDSRAEAHLIAGNYWRVYGKPKIYVQEIAIALKLAPNDPTILSASGELAFVNATDAAAKGDRGTSKSYLDDAASLFIRAIEAATPKLPPPNEPPEMGSGTERLYGTVFRTYQLLIQVLNQAERIPEAEAWAAKATAAYPDNGLLRLDQADIALAQNKLEEAEKIIVELEAALFPVGYTHFLRGRLFAAREQWVEACRALEEATDTLAGNPEVLRRAYFVLASCYLQTGELDRRYEAFRRAIPPDPLDPFWSRSVGGMADTLLELGRPNEAKAEYQRLAARVPEAYLPLIRLRIVEILRQPAGTVRDWASVDAAVPLIPEGPDGELLKAEIAAFKSDITAARLPLGKAIEKYATSKTLWDARIGLELQLKDYARAAELLALAEKQLGDSATIRLLKARLTMASEPATVRAQIARLSEGVEKFKSGEARLLYRGLANVALQANLREVARSLLDKVSALRADDIALQYLRFDLALLDKDEPTQVAVIDQIAKTSGSTSSVSSRVARSYYLLAKAREGDKVALAEASELLSGLERHRGTWGRLYIAQGQAADLRGEYALAAQKYRQSIELGERPVEIIGRLLEIYGQLKLYREAEQLMKSVPENTQGLASANALMVELSLSSKTKEGQARAAELALKTVPEDSKDPKKLVWLARVLILAGRVNEAERPLRRATVVAPEAPDGWIGLIQLLVATNRKADAEAAVQEAKTRINAADAPLVMLECYELIGKQDEARLLLDGLLKTRGGEISILRAAASFYARAGDFARARPLLEKIIGLQSKTLDDDTFARRLLALSLSAGGDYAAAKRAMELLGLADVTAASSLTGKESIEEIRTRLGVLISQKGRKARAASITLYEALETKTPLRTEDHFILGQLHLALDEPAKGRGRLKLAAEAADASPLALAIYASVLIRQGLASDSREAIDRLAKLDPNSPRTIELKARFAKADGKLDIAANLLEQYAQQSGRTDIAARVLEDIGLAAKAEPLFRKRAESGKPEDRFQLAAFFGRAGRISEAMAEYDKVWDSIPPEILIPTVSETLMSSPGTQSPVGDLKKVVERIAAASQKNPKLLVFVAALKSLIGDHDGAVRLGREILAKDPNDVLAMNNLAYVLSLNDGKHAESLKMIRRAIELAGPLPALMDTQAVIEMNNGNPGGAIDLLLEAVVDDPTAISYYHLAQAYRLTGKRLDAVTAMAEAKKRNLRIYQFHPLEHKTFKEMESDLTPKN